MSALPDRLDDWSDRLSPILVKEVRQMVRGREFNYSFGLSLVVGMVVAFLSVAEAVTTIGVAGRQAFVALMVCLALLGLVVIPLGAFSALRSERVEQTLDLITQTPLSPRRIVIGKLLTQGIKLITLFAGMSPFMAMSFLLGGIDLVTILTSLAALFVVSIWVCAACLFLSAASHSRIMSGAFFVVLIAVGIIIVGNLGPLLLSVLGVTGLPVPARAAIWWALGALMAFATMSTINFLLLAENRLTLPIEDRSTALRVGFFVQFLLIVGMVLGQTRTMPGFTGGAPVSPSGMGQALGIYAGLQLAVTATFAVTEDMTVSRRVFRRIRRSLKRPWAIFRPGGGRGAAWILAQMLVMLLIGAFLFPDDELKWLLVICSYVWFFTGVPTVLLKRVLQSRATAAYLRVGILLFFPIVGLSADFFQYVLSPGKVFEGTYSAYHILSPFRTLYNWQYVLRAGWYRGVMVMGAIGLLCYLALIIMNLREDRRARAAS
jgi:hypothetical protein